MTMKDLTKKWLCALLACCLLLGLAACGGTISADGDKTADGADASEETPQTEKAKWLCVARETYKDGELTYTYEMKYNEYGQLLEQTQYKPDGVVKSHQEYTYSDNQVRSGGTRSEVTEFKNVIEYLEYTYEYDAYGRRVSSTGTRTMKYKPGEEGTDRTEEFTRRYYTDLAGTEMGYLEWSNSSSTPTVNPDVYAETNPNAESETQYDEKGRVTRKLSSNSLYEYEYDENDNLAKQTRTVNYTSGTSWLEETYYTYEERVCKIVPERVLPPTKEIDVVAMAVTADADGMVLYHYQYMYDDRGEQVVAYDPVNGIREINEYDENGRHIRTRTDRFLEIIDIVYDGEGKRIREEFREEEDGPVCVYADIEYGENGLPIRSTRHVLDSFYASNEGYQLFEYTEDGKEAAVYVYSQDGALKAAQTYEYAEDGRLASITSCDGNGAVQAVTRPIYATIVVLEE